MPPNLNQRHSLRVAGLEPHRGTGCDIEAEAIRLDAVERELRVCLDEVVVRADLYLRFSTLSPHKTDINSITHLYRPIAPTRHS